jgi:hypothetical protein
MVPREWQDNGTLCRDRRGREYTWISTINNRVDGVFTYDHTIAQTRAAEAIGVGHAVGIA